MLQLLAMAGPSEVARQTDHALLVLVIICLVLLGGNTAVMLYFVVKYRRSKVKKTKQIRGHLPLEVAWTVIPTLIAVGLFFVGFSGFASIRDVPADAMEVQVTGQQWFWSFHYPDQDITSSELYVPVNKAVRFSITAPVNDVLHSFYIPAFRIKEDAVPGAQTKLWLEAEQTGTYNIFCAEFCGKDHSKMLSKLHVLSQADYDQWLRKKVEERYRPVDAAKALKAESAELEGEDGKKLFGSYCAACHAADGKGGGPYNARNFTSLQGWKQGTKLTDIFTTISSGVPGTQMRSFAHLPVRERFALMHQVASFYPGGDRPAYTDADVAALKAKFPECDPEKAQRPVALQPTVPIVQAMEQVVKEGSHR